MKSGKEKLWLSAKHQQISFGLSWVVFIYFFISIRINVYQYALVGAVYELLWLPAIMLLIFIPIISLLQIFKTGFSFRSLPLYSLLLIIVTAMLLYFS